MTYDYYCPTCGGEIVVNHPMSESPDIYCPVCNEKMKIRVTGGIGVIYKGFGWNGSGKKKPGYYTERDRDMIKSGVREDPYKKWRDEPL